MRVIIDTAYNGLIVTVPADEPGTSDMVEVYSEVTSITECPKEHIIYALYSVLEAIGEYGSKHDPHRIQISCESGSSVEIPFPCPHRRD